MVFVDGKLDFQGANPEFHTLGEHREGDFTEARKINHLLAASDIAVPGGADKFVKNKYHFRL